MSETHKEPTTTKTAPLGVKCSDLLGCPFCGMTPKISHREASKEGLYGGGYVAFIVCHCGTFSAKAHQSGGGNTLDEAINSASQHWNTRAT